MMSLALAAFGVTMLAGSAFTASNTVPNATAGDGAGTVSGYTVTGTQYTLNSTDPSKVDGVGFTLSPATASSVKIKAQATGSYYTCTNTSGSVYCATTSPQMTVAASDTFRVIAVG